MAFSKTLLLTITAGVLLIQGTAKADYLVNTLSSSSAGIGPNSPMPNGGSIAEQFTTAPTTEFSTYGKITEVSMQFFNPNSFATGDISFDLYSNAAGLQQKNDLPGTLITNIGSVNINTIGTTTTTVTLSNLIVNVTMNTRYWIVATLNGTVGESISYNVNNDVLAFPGGTVATFRSSGSSAWAYDAGEANQLYMMAIAVPEPSTYALSAATVVLLGYLGKRKKCVIAAASETTV